MIISLKNMEFFGYHGVYAEEQTMGQKFIVTVDLKVDFEPDGSDQLSETYDYEWIYEACSEAMKNPFKLIETVAFNISEGIQSKVDYKVHGTISIRKPEVPFPVSMDGSEITYTF